MKTAETLRHVPWTCQWGRFGEPVRSAWPTLSPRFVFWTCSHPDAADGPLTRDSCDRCGRWHPTSSVPADGRL